MPNHRRCAMAAVGAAFVVPAVLNIGTAHAAPLPSFGVPPNVVDNVCTARLKSVTADVIDGTITGTHQVKDVKVNIGSDGPPNFITLPSGKILFSGLYAGRNGLWQTDGSTGGTTLVKELGRRCGQSGAFLLAG